MMAQHICIKANVSFGYLAHRAGVLVRLSEGIAFATELGIPQHGFRVLEIFFATDARSASVTAPNGGLEQLLIGALELRAVLLCATDGAI